MTDVPEGTIVRCITRLDETCREVRDAARVIGDADLFTKMEEAQALIKRDSEFPSLLRYNWSSYRLPSSQLQLPYHLSAPRHTKCLVYISVPGCFVAGKVC